MQNITHPDNMKFVNQHTRQLSASGYNGLIQSARSNIDMRRGVSNGADITAGKEVDTIRYWMHVKAHEDIPAYSVFTIKDGGFGYSLVEPKPSTDKFSITNESTCVFLTGLEYALYQDGDYFLPVCDFARPYLYKYDSADGTPTIGDRIGPKYGSYEMSLAGNGLSFAVVSDPDTTDLLVWCIKACMPSFSSVTIPMFEFTEPLYPGYVATARKLKWDGISKYIIDSSDTKQYKLFDPEEQNMFLPFERVHAIIAPQLGDFADYEIIGEHGLHRKVLVDGAVDCGQTGDVIVYTNATKLHPPPKHPTDPDCDLAGSSAQLKVCNKYGYRRKIEDQEIATVDWDHGRQAWVFEQEDRGNVIEASLSGVMCGQDTVVAVTGARYFDWQGDNCSLTPDPDVTSVTNSKSLAGPEGATVFCHRKENTIGADEWHIFEVKHRDFILLRPDGGEQGVCPSWTIKQREFAVMTCVELDDEYITISSEEIEVTENFAVNNNSQGCGMNINTVKICVLGVTGHDSYSVPMGRVEFLTGVTVNPSDCSMNFTGGSICGFLPGPGPGGSIPAKFTKVGYAISEGATGPEGETCVSLLTHEIPVLGCDDQNEGSEIIVCLKDCEDEPSEVLPEANTAGTYNPLNRQTQPYDPTGLNPDDIVIMMPASAEIGTLIGIANNSMLDTTVRVHGNGYNVQAITAPYTAAFVSVGGPKISITYQLREIGDPGSGVFEWRIY